MSCKKAEEYLVDYLYQELPAKKTLEIEKHLRECAQCATTLESWRAIHRAYQRSAEEPQVAAYTKQKILAIAEEELLRSPSWQERVFRGLKLATVPIAIFVLVLFLNKDEKKEMAMQKLEPAPPAAAVRENGRIASEPQRQDPVKGQRLREADNYEVKRKASLDLDRVSPSGVDAKEERAAEVFEEEQKKDSAVSSFRDDAPAPAPAAETPPMSPPPALESNARRMENEQQPVGQSAAKLGAASKDAEEPFHQAQNELQKNNVKEGQKLLADAVRSDDSKSLAPQLHQEGSSFQSRGEYDKAIVNFQQVQLNYSDYARMDDVLLRLGDSFAEIGQFDKAVQAYRQVSRNQQKVAADRIQRLQKKQEAQKQLESLGYIDKE